jgi:translocation and assembly module TamB
MAADTQEPFPPRRWGRRIVLFAVGLVVLVWAAPMVAAWTPLVPWACAQAAGYIDGSVHVGSASLGWFSPIILSNVEVRGADDQVIAQIPRIEGDRSLLMLLLDHGDLGSFRLEKPKIDLIFTGKESNLEKMLAKSLRDPVNAQATGRPAPTVMPQIRLEVVDALLKIHDADTKQDWLIQSLTLNAMLFNDAGQEMQVNVQGTLHDGNEAGSLKAELNLHNLTDPNIRATIKGKFSSFPLDLANVLVRRYQPDTQLGGSLQGNCDISAAMTGGKPHVEIVGEITGNHVTLASPALAETLHVERVRIPCTLRLEDEKLIVERADLHSDFGTVTVQGSVDLGGDWRAALDQPDFNLALELNLASLAERLPKTLHLHPDLRLSAGQLSAQCKSQLKNGEIVWQGNVRTSDVRGIKGQQTIAWTEPIALAFQVRNLHNGVPLIDRLTCSARFLHVEGSTTADQFTLAAEADLQQLAEPLGQFIDLDGVKLTGQAKGTIRVQRAKEQFSAQGDAQFRQMNLTWFTHQPWQEEVVSTKFAAQGRIGKAGQQRIETADVTVNLGKDVVVLKLIEPIADLAVGPRGSFFARVEGDLSRWQNRAGAWSTLLDDWQLAGQANLQMQIRLAPEGIECTSASLQASNVGCIGSNLWIQEPTLNTQTAGRWDRKTGTVELTRTKLTCATLQFEADKLSLQPATMAMRGSANIAGDIARLRQWTHDPKAKPDAPMQGTLVGRLVLQSTEDRHTADFDLSLKNFLYGALANPTWREADVKCVGRASYDAALDALQVENIHLAGAMLGADAEGKIEHFTTTKDVDLTGVLTCDLEKMEPQLRPLLGKDVKIAGKDARAFKVAGPLYPKSKANVLAVSISGPSLAPPALSFRELKGEASLHWKSLRALGCDVGPAEAKAVLQQGWLQLYPIETTLNGGKLRIQPNLKLEPEPTEMVLLAGPVIEKAKITPEMCAGALGYAMPILANVAEAEGLISVTLEGGRLPLSAPKTGEVKGTIVLHHAKVGANPILRELGALLKMPPPTSLVKECKVPFHMVNGKVHHSNLELAFGDFTLKSSGVVGLDGSLAIVVETPIPPRLAAAAKLTPAQAKQTIRIPIGGTVDHPRADARALESLTSTLGRSILENQLNRLLQPKR